MDNHNIERNVHSASPTIPLHCGTLESACEFEALKLVAPVLLVADAAPDVDEVVEVAELVVVVVSSVLLTGTDEVVETVACGVKLADGVVVIGLFPSCALLTASCKATKLLVPVYCSQVAAAPCSEATWSSGLHDLARQEATVLMKSASEHRQS